MNSQSSVLGNVSTMILEFRDAQKRGEVSKVPSFTSTTSIFWPINHAGSKPRANLLIVAGVANTSATAVVNSMAVASVNAAGPRVRTRRRARRSGMNSRP